jgi:uncharacterized protein YkwD
LPLCKRMKKLLLFIAALFSFFPSLATYAYSDVPQTHSSFQAIEYLSKNNILKGFDDGTFRPDRPITRAEFMKIVILAKELAKLSEETTYIFPSEQNFELPPTNPIPEDSSINTSLPASLPANEPENNTFTATFESATSTKPTQALLENCFTDVKETDWYAIYLCSAKQEGFIDGYADGSFKPNNVINIAEASKIAVKILNLNDNAITGKYWYSSYLHILTVNNYLPSSVKYLNQDLKRGEVAELIWRIVQEIHTEPSLSESQLEESYCQKSPEDLPANINMDKVRETWLAWYNEVRKAEGLEPYIYNKQLDRTAIIWSEEAEKRGYINHKRAGQTAYYDYAKITAWFKELGLEFKNINRATHTENINWNYYKCSDADCTEKLTQSIRSGFDFFMSEKGKTYSPHYDSIVKPEFKEIGLGIAIDPTNKKYYLTVHYGTEIISEPTPMCE